MKFKLLALIAVTAGCATVPDAPVAIESDAISYTAGPCFGTCPMYTVSIRPDGSGTFEGRRFTAVTGTRSFQATPAQYRAFAAHLAPLRPAEGAVRLSGAACASQATDLPSAEVTWFSQIGNSQSYYLDFGCDRERNRAARERLEAAPDLLPIAALIGPRSSAAR